MFLLGPVTTALCEKFGCRVMAVIGGLLCIIGMIASAYAPTLKIMYLSFGMTWGLGTSFCYFPTLITLVPYFNKKLALVNGIVLSGSGVGTLTLSPFIQWFAKLYGVKNMFYMLGALHSLVFLAGFIYRPINLKYKERQEIKLKERQYGSELDDGEMVIKDNETYVNTSKQDIAGDNVTWAKQKLRKVKDSSLLSLLRDKAYISWCFGLSVFILGYFVPFVHIVSNQWLS